LCDEVVKALGSVAGQRVLELYAGAGNFTRLLTDAREVVAVESAAVPDASATASNVRWVRADAAEYCQEQAAHGEAFDVVLLDPPRSGAREVMESIAAFKPSRVVYVSCDVATLSRDVEALAELGYRASRAQPIDLMPQTAQVEIVLVLERDAAS
jgi:23S rRNA (uracil1939-C5)-methyltransferase